MKNTNPAPQQKTEPASDARITPTGAPGADTPVEVGPSSIDASLESGVASHALRAGRDDLRAFDLIAFIRARRELRGTVRLGDLERMVTEVPADAPAGALDTSLDWFATGETRREVRRDTAQPGRADAALTATSHTVSQPYLTLSIKGKTWLECQRCMKAFELPLQIQALYRVMETEAQADALALDDTEAEVIVGSATFDLIDLIDEEVVLSLPMVPKHDVCPAVHASVVSGADGSLGIEDLAELDARLAGADDVVLPGELPLATESDVAPATMRDGRPNPFAALSGLRQTLAEQGNSEGEVGGTKKETLAPDGNVKPTSRKDKLN
jgi:uncharacterized protein